MIQNNTTYAVVGDLNRNDIKYIQGAVPIPYEINSNVNTGKTSGLEKLASLNALKSAIMIALKMTKMPCNNTIDVKYTSRLTHHIPDEGS